TATSSSTKPRPSTTPSTMPPAPASRSLDGCVSRLTCEARPVMQIKKGRPHRGRPFHISTHRDTDRRGQLRVNRSNLHFQIALPMPDILLIPLAALVLKRPHL